MNNMADIDPLTAYNPYSYPSYDQLPQNGYNYNLKAEQQLPQPLIHNLNNQFPPLYPSFYPGNDKSLLPEHQLPIDNDNQENNIQNEPPEEIDTKEHIQLLPEPLPTKRRTKKKGKTSNYWNKKIEDKNFPFYGCTICNISFTTITELDTHVTVHKGRLTSYDIRLRNQVKRKQKLKELKKLKKLGKKLKKEVTKLEIEIKPEDGYIGNEKASEFNDLQNNVESSNIENRNNENYISNEKAQLNNLQNNPDNINNKNVSGSNEKEVTNIQVPVLNSEVKEDKAQISKQEKADDPRLQKLFKCFACHKQFALSYYLKLHVRSHTDEKPYTCAECGQSFITASKLGRHTKRIHLAVRFQCRICYRFFSRFDILTRHFDKAHKDDKLEGEPYDYNAILPYLKELEEQMKQQQIKEEAKKIEPNVEDKKEVNIEQKMKAEEVWDWPSQEDGDFDEQKGGILFEGDSSSIKEPKEDPDDQPLTVLPIEDIIVEAVRVKQEPEGGGEGGGEGKEDSSRDDGFSDDDYFPSNTWAATPKVEPEAPAKTRKSGPYRRADFPAQCELCDKVIKTPSYYVIHLRTHSGERPFKCYVCDRAFITSSKMHRHVLTHHPTERAERATEEGVKVKEEKRKRKCKSKEKSTVVAKIRKENASRKRPFGCPYCGKKFLHQDTLQVHLKCHEGEKLVLKCTFCLEEMESEDILKEHEQTHGGPKPYLCNICGRSYTKRENMVYHRKTHDAKSRNSEFICDICSKTFHSQPKLQRHIVSHKVEKFMLRYECPVCAHMFNTKYHVQMHLSTHQKEGLILEENRNEILAMVLQNARKIPRGTTDNSAPAVDTIPPDERSRVCNICGQVFQHFYYLEEHLKSHGSKIAVEDNSKEEEKKHICPICNKGFKLHYYLKLHSFTHSKEKPFICQSCGKGFITKGKLKRHLETHSGLKKYQCHICYKFFTRPSYLRIHVRTIHGTQDYNFRMDKQFGEKFCGERF